MLSCQRRSGVWWWDRLLLPWSFHASDRDAGSLSIAVRSSCCISAALQSENQEKSKNIISENQGTLYRKIQRTVTQMQTATVLPDRHYILHCLRKGVPHCHREWVPHLPATPEHWSAIVTLYRKIQKTVTQMQTAKVLPDRHYILRCLRKRVPGCHKEWVPHLPAASEHWSAVSGFAMTPALPNICFTEANTCDVCRKYGVYDKQACGLHAM